MASRPPLLALKDIRLSDGPVSLFEGVDLALEPRARACLVGSNGAGKSTLLRLLAGQIEPDGGERFIQPGTRIALVDQEPRISGATLEEYATAGGAPAHRAAGALASLGLDPARATGGLSGGETRRAALARAFAEEPDIFLLDEPTNHLDIAAIATLEARLGRSRAVAILTISHDRAFLNAVTQACFWLSSRKVRRLDAPFGKFDAWSTQLAEEEAESLHRLSRAIERETATFYSSITARRTRNEGRARSLSALRADYAARRSDLQRGMALPLESGQMSGRLVADLKDVSKTFGDRTLFKNLTLRVLRGDRLAIVGPNGAGKTTLVRTLLGEISPDAGQVTLGASLTIAYADQARARLPQDATLWDTLAPDGGDQVLVRGAPRHVAAYARDFLFADRQLRQPVSSLSGGERNRLLLAIALAKPANVLVLDEPTNDLDMDTMDLLQEALTDYDGTLILISHDRDFIDRLATSTIALNGRGGAVETPGGWSDLMHQNPGYFDAAEMPEANASSPRANRPATPAGRLSFKDQHRLGELEKQVPSLETQITALESRLDDANLYASDPKTFTRLVAEHADLKSKLAAAEDEWLALEERREALGRA